jgi:hypothetical protein
MKSHETSIKMKLAMKGFLARQITDMAQRENEIQISEYTTMDTKEIEDKLGPFSFHEPYTITEAPVELEDGSIYVGEWNAQSQRHGRGM